MAPQNDAIHGDIQQVIHALQQNKQDITQQINDLARRQEQQTTATQTKFEELRKELQQLFVPRSEYDPRHSALEQRILTIEKAHENGYTVMQEFTVLKEQVRQNKDEIEELESARQGLAGRIIPVIAVIASVVSVLLTMLQHIQIR